LIGDYRAAVEAEHGGLEELDELLESTPEAFYARATVLFGLKVSAAIVEWSEEVERLMPDQAIRIDPRRREGENALRLLTALPRRRAAAVRG
jgi:hypothetical protein